MTVQPPDDRDPDGTVQGYYDRYWTDEGFNPANRVDGPFREILTRYVTAGARVLDLGCGDGSGHGIWLTERGAEYRGVDVSRPAVQTARERGLDVTLIEDASTVPFPDGSFDVVVMSEVLEHLFAPQHAVLEVARLLRPGGVFAATVPNSAYWRRRADLAVLGRWNPLGNERSAFEPWCDPHIRFFTRWALNAMLSAHGFTVLESGAYGGTITGDIPLLRRFVRPFGHEDPQWWPHPVYRRLEQALPGLFGVRLYAVATASG
jgi:methionine biosynthesis protein MetW